MSAGTRFTRVQSRPLGDWLLDLVSGDLEKQMATSKMLDRLRSQTPEGFTVEQQWAEIDRAVRAAVRRKKFPRRAFVRRLVIGLEAAARHEESQIQQALELGESWVREVDWESLAEEDLCETDLDETLKERQRPAKALDSMRSMHLFLAHRHIFNALGAELLDAQDLLRIQIGCRLSQETAEWLQRQGPAGRGFLPEVLRWLDQGKVRYHPWTPALAAIVGEDLEAIAQVAERLDASDYEPPPPWVPGTPGRAPSEVSMRLVGTLQTLALIGKSAFRIPGLLGRIEALIGFFPTEAIEALGAVGGDREAVLQKLIVFTDHPDWRYQAGAILGLAHFPSHTPRAVSVLCDCLVLFEEMDGDWNYNGDHERVLGSLGAYGVEALPAIDTLEELGFFTSKRHVGKEQKSFARFLGHLGPLAAERALVPFEALIAKIYEGEEEEVAEDMPDATPDLWPMLWALRRLRDGDGDGFG